MPTITYVNTDGTSTEVDADQGETVMSAALRSGVPGIIGECGGNTSCATCHVWVREEFVAVVGEPDDLEDDLLDLGVSERRETSRLGCQIVLAPELDGLVVDVPPTQP